MACAVRLVVNLTLNRDCIDLQYCQFTIVIALRTCSASNDSGATFNAGVDALVKCNGAAIASCDATDKTSGAVGELQA